MASGEDVIEWMNICVSYVSVGGGHREAEGKQTVTWDADRKVGRKDKEEAAVITFHSIRLKLLSQIVSVKQ